MKDGIYKYSIVLGAPIGPRHGELELNVQNGRADGALTLFRENRPISGSIRQDGVFTLSGELKTLLYMLPYTAEGTATERAITMILETKKGSFSLSGVAAPTEVRA